MLCIGAGIVLGKLAPEVAVKLGAFAIYQVSIPIAICPFFMMYPIMVKIDFAEVLKAAKTPKPVALTLFINWAVKPFTMYLIAGYFSRKWLIKLKGLEWFRERFLHWLTPISIAALLSTLVLLFSFKGEIILKHPLTIVWIAIPLFIQTIFIFALGYGMARLLRFSYEDAAPVAMIGASNHFEVAIATAAMLFGLSSGASLVTVVGVLIEVPVMLMLVSVCKKTCHVFTECNLDLPQCKAGYHRTRRR